MRKFCKILMTLFCVSTMSSVAVAQEKSKGEKIYKDYCEACHQPGGVGSEDVYLPLNGNPFVVDDELVLIDLILKGRAGMPAFIEDLEKEELTTILNYIRTNWENEGSKIKQSTMDKQYKIVYDALDE